MALSRALLGGLISALVSLAGTHAAAQTAAASRPVGFVVPEWKGDDGKLIIRARGRAQHDVYRITRDFDGGSINGEVSNDETRAIRFGIDGEWTPKIKFRADADLINSQVNWVEVYAGYAGSKYEFFVGQQRITAALETASSDTASPLTETSLVTSAFGQGLRSFGATAKIKSADWQVVGGLYSGNLNAGDIFGDDVLRYAQVRATYSPRHKDRDVVHVGASLRLRDTQDGALLRYGTRPASINYGPRTLDSSAVASDDTTLSFEGLVMRGPLTVSAEHQVLWADTARGTAALNGTYVEAAWSLTGEARRYSVGSGSLGGIKPKKSVRLGGPGAISLVGRLEQLDQSDSVLGARAGRVQAATLGVAWTPVDFVMLRLAASHSIYSGPNAAREGTADVVMARAQFSF